MQASYSELQVRSQPTETPLSGFSDVGGDAIGLLSPPLQAATSSNATIRE